jgi:hypothetical protein
MPQPSTQRPILDSFLPQFAPISDEQTPREMIPAGESDVGLPVHGGRTNGHSAAFEADEFFGALGHASAGALNGTADNPAVDQDIAPTPTGVNGNGAGHVNGTARIESAKTEAGKIESGAIESTLRAAVSEVLATTVASRASAAQTNGAAHIEIGEPPVPPAPAIQPPSDEELLSPPEQAQSPAESVPLAEHPAAGSCFTPYLVTEIRELRNRCKRRSWWRRLFG